MGTDVQKLLGTDAGGLDALIATWHFPSPAGSDDLALGGPVQRKLFYSRAAIAAWGGEFLALSPRAALAAKLT